MAPSKTPLRSANRNQPWVFPLDESTCCHRPVTTGSCAGAAAAARSVRQAAANEVWIGRIIGTADLSMEYASIASQCGDFREQSRVLIAGRRSDRHARPSPYYETTREPEKGTPSMAWAVCARRRARP